MTAGPIFTSRLTGRRLLDSDGLAVGRVRDVVILPTASSDAPWVLGLVVTLQRRHIFVNLGRLAEISVDGVYLRSGTVDLRRFSRRTGEILASELYGRPAGAGTVLDVGIAESERPACGTTTRRSCPGTSTRSCSRQARWPSSSSSCARCTPRISPARWSGCRPPGPG